MPILVVAGLLAFLGVSSGASSVKLSSARADARFAVDSNAAAAQYCSDTSAGCSSTPTPGGTTPGGTTTTPGGTATEAVTVTSPVVTATTAITVTTGAGSTGTSTGSSSGSTPGTIGSGTITHGKGKSGSSSHSSASSGSGSGTGSSGSGDVSGTSGPAYCGSVATSAASQAASGVVMNDDVSGDIGLYGADATGANGVSGIGDLSSAVADQTDSYSGGETVFNDAIAVGDTALEWNTGSVRSVVAYCKFWPVDPWGRWGMELFCNQSTPCYDSIGATSDDPAEEGKSEPVASQTTFTVPADKLALVHLTLNHLGEQLLTQADGQLTGSVDLHSVKTQQNPTVLTGQRSFHIYYVRCNVWGSAKPVADSLEAKFAASPIGKAYATRGLSDLASADKGCS